MLALCWVDDKLKRIQIFLIECNSKNLWISFCFKGGQLLKLLGNSIDLYKKYLTD